MRRVLLAVAALSFAGCASDDVYSPSNPESFSIRMFDQAALKELPPEQRAYVMGHAIGVYLYGKTLPYEVRGTGFFYTPGVSAPEARVPYRYEDVMLASSGGLDGAGGTGTLFDDVGDPEQPGDDGDGGDPPCDDGSDDVYTCDPEDPDDPSGDPGDDGDGDPPTEPVDPWIDGDCETFLNPAALRARDLGVRVNVPAILEGELAGFRDAFEQGLRDALRLEDLGENTRHSEVEELKDTVQAYGMCDHSPIVLDLDGDGLTASAPHAGVRFDLFGVGASVRTAWPTGGDALLAIDLDGDGRIASGRELFGEATRGGYSDGFAALAALDDWIAGGNGDGVIDASDAAFSRLVLWRDADRDGVSDDGELAALWTEEIVALPLSHATSDARDAGGNAIRLVGSFLRASGDAGTMADVWFRIHR
jgi:hypothetical protein